MEAMKVNTTKSGDTNKEENTMNKNVDNNKTDTSNNFPPPPPPYTSSSFMTEASKKTFLEKVSEFSYDNIYDVIITMMIIDVIDKYGFFATYNKEFNLMQYYERIGDKLEASISDDLGYLMFDYFGAQIIEHRIKEEKNNNLSTIIHYFINEGIPFLKTYAATTSGSDNPTDFVVDELLERIAKLLE